MQATVSCFCYCAVPTVAHNTPVQVIMAALSAPHEGEEEPIYPGTCRCAIWETVRYNSSTLLLPPQLPQKQPIGKLPAETSLVKLCSAGAVTLESAPGPASPAADSTHGTEVAAKLSSRPIPSGGSGLSKKQRRLLPKDRPVPPQQHQQQLQQRGVSWRFRVTDGETISFVDGHFGPQVGHLTTLPRCDADVTLEYLSIARELFWEWCAGRAALEPTGPGC